MELTILTDRSVIPGKYLLAEQGFSCFIEDAGKKFLVNAGYSGNFIQNAAKLNINIFDTDVLIFTGGSHHLTLGLEELTRLYSESLREDLNYKKPSVIAHPFTFLTRLSNQRHMTGAHFTDEKLSYHFNLKLSKGEARLTERLLFLGEINRGRGFDDQPAAGKLINEREELDDYHIDDSALLYESSAGLVIITGSSESGICNIIEHAIKSSGIEKIAAVIGGFNLVAPDDNRLRDVLKYIKSVKPLELYPCFNTDMRSKIALNSVSRVKEAGAGLKLVFRSASSPGFNF